MPDTADPSQYAPPAVASAATAASDASAASDAYGTSDASAASDAQPASAAVAIAALPGPAADSPALILPAGSHRAASASALRPPRLSAPRARLASTVRRGCYVHLAHAAATLSMELADAAPGAKAAWDDPLFLAPPDGDSADGCIEIADGARLLQGLTGIHPGRVRSPGMAPWLAAALAGRLAATPFAGLGVAAPQTQIQAEERCCLRLTLRSRHHMFSSLARASAPAWLAFLARGDWTSERTPVRPWLAAVTGHTITAAQHTLPAGALRSLALGDVIVPDTPRFGPGGEGWIRLANRHLRVRHAAPNSLQILEVERTVTTTDMQYDADISDDGLLDDAAGTGPENGAAAHDGWDEDSHGPDNHGPEPELGQGGEHGQGSWPDAVPESAADTYAGFDAIPVTLGFELGKVSLPLADARTLGPGAVLLLDGGSPASVAIVSAGRTLGRGEIVDVAGQLGIRVIQWGAP